MPFVRENIIQSPQIRNSKKLNQYFREKEFDCYINGGDEICTSKVIENNIGYIQIPSFDNDTGDEFEAKYNELKEKNIKSLVIDLRNNGGGIVK